MKRVILVACWILSFAAISSAQTTFYFPHIANGVLGSTIWKTTIFLTNPAASGTASGTITFANNDGTPYVISFADENGQPNTGSTITFSIPAGTSKKYLSSGQNPYAPGFAVVSSSGTVSGTSIFSELDLSGNAIAEAGVPQAAALPKQAIFVDTTGGYSVGVAYANPSSKAANVTLSLLSTNGAPVASTTQLFGAGNHASGFTTDFFKTVTTPVTGTMVIESDDVPLAAIALRFASSGVFSTIPPVSIASVFNPAILWLEERPWLAPLTSVARLLGAFQMRV
jgi:hypothetical protein